MRKNSILAVVFTVALLFVITSLGSARTKTERLTASTDVNLGTGFTYQGYLETADEPVTDTCDFQFSLYGSISGTDQVGVTKYVTGVTVSGGYFTVNNLDFGSGAFQGSERYLQISVRCPAGSGGYTALSPRQMVQPAPYALALPGLWTQPNATSPNLIGGYSSNTVQSNVVGATIGGGGSQVWGPNSVAANYGTIAGGVDNQVTMSEATVGGGAENTASGRYSTVGGGYQNTAGDRGATVIGGIDNQALGEASFAGGNNATAAHDGAFVWADNSGAGMTSTAEDQFNVYASGGVNIQTDGAPFLINGVSPGSYSNVIIIADSGGDYASIQDALDSITDASDDNPYLLWLTPGVYNEQVTMKPYVDIEGLGENVTRITYSGSDDSTQATVIGASHAGLRNITVENTGGIDDDYAIAIYNDATKNNFTNVTAIASGGTTAMGFYNLDSSPLISGATISVTATTDQSAWGVSNVTSSPFIEDSTILMTCSNMGCGAVANDSSSTSIRDSALAGGVVNTADGDNYTVTISNSQITLVTGTTNSIINDSEYTVQVALTLLEGYSVTTGTVNCAGVYDENYNFYTNTCP